MKTLPCYITAHLGGFYVRVTRNKVTYRAWVAERHSASTLQPLNHSPALQRAIALRDRFLRIHGEVANRHRVKGRSNTGYSGISESVKWSRGTHAYPCFEVSWCVAGRQRLRRFTYGPKNSRTAALAHAIRHREQMTGLKLTATH